MKIYSEELKQLFDTVEECENAELEAKKAAEEAEAKAKALKENRAERAKAIEAKYKELFDLQQEINEMKNEFISDYGSFHVSFRNATPKIFDWLMNW